MRGVTCLSKENCLFNDSKTKIKCSKNELLRHITKTDQNLRSEDNSARSKPFQCTVSHPYTYKNWLIMMINT